jgi:hypothetical protein
VSKTILTLGRFVGRRHAAAGCCKDGRRCIGFNVSACNMELVKKRIALCGVCSESSAPGTLSLNP